MQGTYGGGQFDAFVAEINPTQLGAASLVYSTYLGGSDQDASYGIAVDGSGNAYVTGFTYSLDFPTKNAYQPQRTPQTTARRDQRCFCDEDHVQLTLDAIPSSRIAQPERLLLPL